MNVTVIGTGYVGLVAGACLAETGNDVRCADLDEVKIARLQQNDIPIYEPGLDTLVERNQAEGRLHFTTDVPTAVKGAEVIIIAVGTPPDEDGSADLRHVLAAARTIGEHLANEAVIVTKSTVPVGTAAKIDDALSGVATHPYHVCSNPEFLKEGDAVSDFLYPDRVIIGAATEHARSVLTELYAPFVRTGKPIIFMDVPSAEMTKYAANAMLATRISFMNEIALLCERTGANVDLVRKGIGSDPRIGSSFLFPGAGYGGSCFPKDVKALIRTGRDVDASLDILSSVEAVNDRQKRRLFEKVVAAIGDLDGARVAIWGLAFKPNTDDLRDAPALVLIDQLLAAGATVCAHDPVAMPGAKQRLGDRVDFVDSNYDALPGADALVVVTEWNAYRNPDFKRIKETLSRPVLIDGRNLYDPIKMHRLGFTYDSFGRINP